MPPASGNSRSQPPSAVALLPQICVTLGKPWGFHFVICQMGSKRPRHQIAALVVRGGAGESPVGLWMAVPTLTVSFQLVPRAQQCLLPWLLLG